MKALILNGSENEKSTVNTVSDYLVDFLRINDHKVDVMVLRDEMIAPCLGCFGCWLPRKRSIGIRILSFMRWPVCRS